MRLRDALALWLIPTSQSLAPPGDLATLNLPRATTPLRFPDALPAVQCDTDLYKGIIDALMPDVFQKLAEGVVASTVAGVVTAVESGHLILNGQSMHTRNEPQHLAVATASGACLLSLHTSSSVSALV